MNEELIQEKKHTDLGSLTLSSLFSVCEMNSFACAFYRLPTQYDIHGIVDLHGSSSLNEVRLEELDEGFVFHPFSKEAHAIKFIKKDLHFVFDAANQKMRTDYSILEESQLSELFSILDTKKSVESSSKYTGEVLESLEEKQAFLRLIERALLYLRGEKLQKVITARHKRISLPNDFDPALFFQNLCATYTNSFVYLTYIPGLNIWCGATPEALIEVDSDGIFKTVALAATQENHLNHDITELTWNSKDIEEQALVSRYIINCFKQIRLREFEEIGPRSYESGNLIHLKTEFLVNTKQVGFPNLGSVMLGLLHPTSAVCGMPKEDAFDFIEQEEGFDRGYFTGYLGPVNLLGESHIFVNLRCMKVSNGHAELYAGAGILVNSIPEKEWHETEIKMDTLLAVLKQGR